MQTRNISLVTVALSTALTMVSMVAAAQDGATDEAGLEEVVVTAQRREENLQSVPVSVTAVTAETLSERGIRDLSQMEGLSPGFTFGRSGSDARPAMRGVRTENVGVNGDTTIGYFIDGIYQSRAQQALAAFVDVERVEIQRGPQGTLYGRNTFGGNISVTTRQPKLGELQYGFDLTGAEYSRARADGYVNVPLGERAALRIAALYDKSDGWVENDFNSGADLFDQDMKYARAALRFEPTEQFTVVARADFLDQGGNGGSAFGYKQAGSYFNLASCQQLFNDAVVVANVRPGNRDAVNDCTRTVAAPGTTVGSSVDTGIPLYAAGDGYAIDQEYDTFVDLSGRNASLELAYDFGAVTLKSITGYSDFEVTRTSDSDFSASTIAFDYQLTSAETFSQELQLLSNGDGPVSYVAGLYYFDDELNGTFINQQVPRTIRSAALTTPLTLAQNGAGFYDQQRPETKSTAFYGQLTWKATDALSLTVGARYTEDKKDFRFANANSVLPLTVATGGAFAGQQQPDARLITLATGGIPDAAFGVQGATNCPAVFVTGLNGGASAFPPGPGFVCGGPNNNVLLGATYNQAKFSKTTGRIAVDYQLADDKLLYASFSTGFRSGGFNSGQAAEGLRTFLPEEVDAIEIGSKNRFLDNRLQLNAAAYFNKYENLQEQRQIPAGSTTVSIIFNAAKAEAKGLELEAEFLATDEFRIGGTLAWLDAEYTSFPDAPLPFGTSILVVDATQTTPTVVNGVTIAPAGQRRVFAPGYNCGVVSGTGQAGQPAAAFGCDLSGNKVPYAPEFQGSLFASYDFKLGNGGTIRPLVAINFSDDFFGQPTNASLERQKSFVKADVKLTWDVNDSFSAQLFADNVTDEDTINRFVWGGGGALQVSYAPPRMVGVRVSYKN
jgi:iron complex outermembrane receptor protein